MMGHPASWLFYNMHADAMHALMQTNHMEEDARPINNNRTRFCELLVRCIE